MEYHDVLLTYLLGGWVFMHKIWPGRRAHWVKYNKSDFDCMSLASFCQSWAAELFPTTPFFFACTLIALLLLPGLTFLSWSNSLSKSSSAAAEAVGMVNCIFWLGPNGFVGWPLLGLARRGSLQLYKDEHWENIYQHNVYLKKKKKILWAPLTATSFILYNNNLI